MSKVHVKVEHAISGIKRSRIVKDILRNTKDNFSDLVMIIACGLHNFRVDRRKKPLKLWPNLISDTVYTLPIHLLLQIRHLYAQFSSKNFLVEFGGGAEGGGGQVYSSISKLGHAA